MGNTNYEQLASHFRQVYFSLPTPLAEAFKVKCAQERKPMKKVLFELVEAYVNGNKKGK